MVKKIILALLMSMGLLKGFAQTAKDSVAIHNLLEKEAATWRAGDIKGHAECWVSRPYGRIVMSTTDGRVLNLPSSIIINPSSGMAGNGGKAIISNLKLGITKQSALAIHDEESISKDGISTFSYEVRFLEKIKGEWKLVGQSVHQYKKN